MVSEDGIRLPWPPDLTGLPEDVRSGPRRRPPTPPASELFWATTRMRRRLKQEMWTREWNPSYDEEGIAEVRENIEGLLSQPGDVHEQVAGLTGAELSRAYPVAHDVQKGGDWRDPQRLAEDLSEARRRIDRTGPIGGLRVPTPDPKRALIDDLLESADEDEVTIVELYGRKWVPLADVVEMLRAAMEEVDE